MTTVNNNFSGGFAPTIDLVGRVSQEENFVWIPIAVVGGIIACIALRGRLAWWGPFLYCRF